MITHVVTSESRVAGCLNTWHYAGSPLVWLGRSVSPVFSCNETLYDHRNAARL